MTLSNFDWTDKTSVRWFILLPTGHEGPYDLLSVRRRSQEGKLSREVQVWAEGLPQPITLADALQNSESAPKRSRVHELADQLSEEAAIPPLPTDVDGEIPPIPSEEAPAASVTKTSRSWSLPLLGVILFLLLGAFFALQWIEGHEKFEIRRYSKMSPELHQRIHSELSFKSWGERIFFKEYVPADLSHIWLVTSSFQSCDVEANFQSVKDKLIAAKDEPVAFKTTGVLRDHVVEFTSFDFRSGTRILPGLYELIVKATNCVWDGPQAKLANLTNDIEENYIARTKVILYPNGAAAYNADLAALLKKKEEKAQRELGVEQLFWQDLQQKFQTLLAIGLQIEQHFLDFLESDPKKFKQNLAPAIDAYTRKYGNFLTNFVVANEAYFDQLGDVKDRAKKLNYEVMVNATSKKIGHESMKLIEEFQRLKAPSKPQLLTLQGKLKKTFAGLKEDINQKIILVSEDHPY